MLSTPQRDRESSGWDNRRILWLIAVGSLIITLIFRAPQEIEYISERSRELVLTIVLAMAGTYLLRPIVRALLRWKWLNHHRSGRMWAALIVFVGCGLGLWLFFLLGLKPVANDVRELWTSLVPSDPVQRAAAIDRWRASFETALQPYRAYLPIDVSAIERSLPEYVGQGGRLLYSKISHSLSPGFIVELILIPVLVFYFLTDGRAIRAEARLLSPQEWRESGGRMLNHFDRVLDGYIRGQVIMCLIAWVLVTIGLLILGVPYAWTLGMIAGITRAVPVIGPLLGGIPLVIVCLITTRSMQTTLLLLLGFTLMHFLESKVLLPKIVGHEVDLHPVSVIVALLIGMEFFGFLGVFLAVPLAAVLKIILTEFHERRALQAVERGDAATLQAVSDAEALVAHGAKNLR